MSSILDALEEALDRLDRIVARHHAHDCDTDEFCDRGDIKPGLCLSAGRCQACWNLWPCADYQDATGEEAQQ